MKTMVHTWLGQVFSSPPLALLQGRAERQFTCGICGMHSMEQCRGDPSQLRGNSCKCQHLIQCSALDSCKNKS